MTHLWKEPELKALGGFAYRYLQEADNQPDLSVAPSLPGRYVSDHELRSHLLTVVTTDGQFNEMKLTANDLPDRYTFGQMMGRYGQGCHPNNDRYTWILRSGNLYKWINGKGKISPKQNTVAKPAKKTPRVKGDTYTNVHGTITVQEGGKTVVYKNPKSAFIVPIALLVSIGLILAHMIGLI